MKLTEIAEKPKRQVRFPLSIKFTLIVTLILLGSIVIITSIMGFMVRSEFVRNTDDSNFSINSRAAAGVEERLSNVRSEAFLLLDMSAAAGDNISLAWQIRNIFFERNPYIAAVVIPGVQEIINQQFFDNNEISHDKLTSWLAGETDPITHAQSNDPVILNASPAFGINLLALFYPWQNRGYEDACVVFFSPQNLLEITSAGPSSTLVVNSAGDILISQDFSQILSGVNILDSPLMQPLEKNSGETVRFSYSDGGNRFLAAGQRISFADAAVFSILDYSLITGQITNVSRRNIILAVTILFFAIIITWFFSKNVTNPLKKLIAAAGRIELGEFNLDLKSKSWDELGVLTERFIDMGKGLSSWEETRDLAGRYNSQMITRKFILKEVNLEGENLQAVVLSVDLVSFPEMAEKTDAEKIEAKKNKAKEALSFLNLFISQITECVEATGGVIDKIMGNRIIALWGIPVSQEDITADIMNSLRSALKMRDIIGKLNSKEENAGQVPFKMACGIHTGTVLAGSMGISHYRVYTVAGTVVNEAIKYGENSVLAETDIVISKAVRDLAGNRILAEELTIPKRYRDKEKLKNFGFVNFTPAQGEENQTWPATLKDVQNLLSSYKMTAETKNNPD